MVITKPEPALREAILYHRLDHKRVRCVLCAHRCLIAEGKRGLCLVRENRDGTLFTHAYGTSNSHGVDPVEKKPLYHFLPGSMTYSIATAGCNFRCRFCQNWQISQVLRAGRTIWGEELSPERIVALARKNACRSVAYTYTEPTIFFEYAYDTAKLAYRDGRKNIFVTNGYMTPEALQLIQPYLQAANVDLKSFDDEFYRKVAGATLQPVLDTLKLMKELNIWVEVTTLIIPTLNDSADTLRAIARFIASELGEQTPWHVTRFFPAYDLEHVPPTSAETLHRARDIGYEAGLQYVYEGNVPGEIGTSCHNCGELVVRRSNNVLIENRLVQGRCPNCGAEIPGVFAT